MEQLQAACLALLLSTQAHPIGFPTLRVEDSASLASQLNIEEIELLALYDKMQDLTLQKAQLSAASSESGSRVQELTLKDHREDIDKGALERELVFARANRHLKETVIETTLATLPILRAVHGNDTSAAASKERALFSLLERRDTLSSTHASLSHLLSTALAELGEAEREHIELREQNRELAVQAIERARIRQEEARKRRGPEYQAEQENLRQMKNRWEVVSNITQSIITQSGVDWSRDDNLRGTVLECGKDV